MAYLLSNKFKNDLMNAVHNWPSGGQTYKFILVASTYTASASHSYVSDVTGGATNYELNSAGGGSGYQAGFSGTGRQSFVAANRATTTDNTNNVARWMYSAKIAFPAINAGTIGGGWIYKHNTSDTDSLLVAFLSPPNLVTNGAEVDYSFDQTNGIFWI